MFDLITECGILGPQEKLRWKLSEMVEVEPMPEWSEVAEFSKRLLPHLSLDLTHMQC
jgi:hypothetical protein